jgi:hypothetical protein
LSVTPLLAESAGYFVAAEALRNLAVRSPSSCTRTSPQRMPARSSAPYATTNPRHGQVGVSPSLPVSYR